MCIICLQFQKDKDIFDAKRMLQKAREEVTNIDPEHLDGVERYLKYLEEEDEGK